VTRGFRYCRDPLFLGACGLYAVNRLALKPLFAIPFLRGQFNDLLLIPCALPPLLFAHRKLGLRSDDAMPRMSEIALHTAVWIGVCELIGPCVWRGTGDWLDVAAYVTGAVVTGWLWSRTSRGGRGERE
jgi:hypothetical protein